MLEELLLHRTECSQDCCVRGHWFISQVMSALPSVLWRCRLGGRKDIQPVQNRVVGCWCGCLSGARCRVAYGPADATAAHCSISWAICKSALHSRQTTMPAPHHSLFYRPDVLPAAHPAVSKHWRHRIQVNVKKLQVDSKPENASTRTHTYAQFSNFLSQWSPKLSHNTIEISGFKPLEIHL